MAKAKGTKPRGGAPGEPLAPSLVVEDWPIDRPIPYPGNPRLNDSAVAGVASSIREFGFRQPIVVDEDGVVLVGHTRLKAAKVLGLATVPVHTARGLTPERAKAYRLADNRRAQDATWNEDALAAELLGLLDLGFDLALTGFSDGELAALLDDQDAGGGTGATAGSLFAQFLVPPFSVLDARAGYWQERKREWLATGILSELGRGHTGPGHVEQAAPGGRRRPAARVRKNGKIEPGDGRGRSASGIAVDPTQNRGASIFDPVLCELVYRWFSPPGGFVLDPFAGGSVRGIVAGTLGRSYLGIDLRLEQVEANEEQARDLLPFENRPRYLVGDGAALDDLVPDTEEFEFDLVFSCPPYADLEVYSDDPRDLSTMDFDRFVEVYRQVIAKAVARLRPNRFAVFVVGEVRERSRAGYYRGLVPETVRAFEDAGAKFYNEAVLVTAVGSLTLRATKPFDSARKLGKTHQNVLVFVKGDPVQAARDFGKVEVAWPEPQEGNE